MPARHAPASESGFVLVGVVVLVLALTIIGVSLFSLSSYEAQFFQRSLDTEQAFQSAVGGLERAKLALAQTSRLSSVRSGLPPDNVDAVAVQDHGGVSDSTGQVDWQGTEVTIRVTAEVNGAQRTVEGRFQPRRTLSGYSQVITTSRGIVVDAYASDTGSPTDRRFTVALRGSVGEGVFPPDFTSWVPLLRQAPDTVRTDAVPAPDLAAYFAEHPVNAATPAPYAPATQTYTLHAPENDVEYFRAPAGCAPDDFYYRSQPVPANSVWVHGLAVWEFPKGVRFDGPLRVSGPGGGNNCLVIVAGQAGPQPAPENDPETGIRLFAGLKVEPGVSVILVSSGRVCIQHMSNPTGDDSYADDISIYAQDATLTGPEGPALHPASFRTMTLQHVSTGDLDTRCLRRLADLGALPEMGFANGNRLSLLPGSWRASGR